MAALFSNEGARFLYRNDQGTIDRRTWWLGTAPLAFVLVILTLIWMLLAPNARHDLGEKPLFDAAVFGTYLYVFLYAFAILLISVSFTNLSAKRLRDLNLPTPLGSVLPFAALLTGGYHWMQMRVVEVLPNWTLYVVDGLLLCVLAWCIVQMGGRAGDKG
jgi:uncharacterized membrane protein YhaH (DUF805 family)